MGNVKHEVMGSATSWNVIEAVRRRSGDGAVNKKDSTARSLSGGCNHKSGRSLCTVHTVVTLLFSFPFFCM